MSGLLDNFERFMHEEDYISPLVKIALLHSQFEMIHPFLNGNGRIGRLLIVFYLASRSILHKPTLYLSGYFKKNRKAYYDCLYNIHSQGDYETWIKFFLNGIIEVSNESYNMARDIAALIENDLRKINTLGRVSQNAMAVYGGLFDKPTVSVEGMVDKLKISYASAGRLVDRLMEIDILSSLDSRKRKKVFVYKNYMDIFSKD